MFDTHDERGGDECVPEDLVWAAYRELQRTDRTFPVETLTLARDVLAVVLPLHEKQLREQLAAATARAGKAEAERDELREYVTALNEAQVSLQSSSFEVGWWKGFKAMPTAGVHTQAYLDTVEYADELRALNADAAVAPDATRDGRSEPVERSEEPR